MKSLMLQIVDAVHTRRDPELGQALTRLVWGAVIAMYIFSVLFSTETAGPSALAVAALLVSEFVVAAGLLRAILRSPGVSYPRRFLAMATDYGLLGAMMVLIDRAGAPLYIVVLWVTVGNGLRYGRSFLHVATLIACSTMIVVICNAPFWLASPALAWGLVLGSAAIPLYVSSLIRDLYSNIDEAKRSSQSKSQFLADMSQEFRTPLNGIVGMADLLATTSLSPEQLESAEVIQTSARSLQLLVDDVLDVSALESGALKRTEVDFRVSEIVKSVQVMLMPTAMAKGIGFKVIVQPHVPNRLHGDAPHLRQILLNLGARAIRMALDGRVAMNVTLLGDVGPDAVRLRFAVRHVPARGAVVWDPRLTGAKAGAGGEPAASGSDSETALATTIVRTLTDLLGGSIGSDVSSGNDTHVWVDLPFALTDQDASSLPVLDGSTNVVPFDDPCLRHRARIRTMRVLVADDQAANRLVVQRILERAGHIVVPACDGAAALELARTGEYDVAIIDMHLPRCNALRMVTELKLLAAGREAMPVIILSADATLGATRAAMEAGARACLSKPIAIGRLLEELADIASRGGVSAVAETGYVTPVDDRVIADLAALRLGPTFVKDFVEQCIVDAQSNLDLLESAVLARNWSSMNEAADALRGVCVNLGARVLASRCAELMKLSPDVIQREWRARIEGIRSQLELVKVGARAEAKRVQDNPPDPSAASDAPLF